MKSKLGRFTQLSCFKLRKTIELNEKNSGYISTGVLHFAGSRVKFITFR